MVRKSKKQQKNLDCQDLLDHFNNLGLTKKPEHVPQDDEFLDETIIAAYNQRQFQFVESFEKYLVKFIVEQPDEQKDIVGNMNNFQRKLVHVICDRFYIDREYVEKLPNDMGNITIAKTENTSIPKFTCRQLYEKHVKIHGIPVQFQQRMNPMGGMMPGMMQPPMNMMSMQQQEQDYQDDEEEDENQQYSSLGNKKIEFPTNSQEYNRNMGPMGFPQHMGGMNPMMMNPQMMQGMNPQMFQMMAGMNPMMGGMNPMMQMMAGMNPMMMNQYGGAPGMPFIPPQQRRYQNEQQQQQFKQEKKFQGAEFDFPDLNEVSNQKVQGQEQTYDNLPVQKKKEKPVKKITKLDITGQDLNSNFVDSSQQEQQQPSDSFPSLK